MVVKVYYSSVSSNLEIKKHQQKIIMILDGKKIQYELLDVAADESLKHKMRDLSGNPKALPPQIFNEDNYCGDYNAFDDAVESDELDTFLKL